MPESHDLFVRNFESRECLPRRELRKGHRVVVGDVVGTDEVAAAAVVVVGVVAVEKVMSVNVVGVVDVDGDEASASDIHDQMASGR